MISKLIQRLLIFFIGIPLVLGIVFLNFENHLLMHAVLIIVILISSSEMYTILSTKNPIQPKIFLSILSIIPLSVSYCCLQFSLSTELIFLSFIFIVLLSFIVEVFFPRKKDNINFSDSLSSCTSTIFHLFYCGLLPTFISQISQFENSSKYLAIYFLLVFSCDSLAWFFGILFGKNNRNFIKVSPNKSIVGFLGGIAGTIGVAILCTYIFPTLFSKNLLQPIFLGLCISLSGIFGDLVESLFKRSASCKDSGSVIMGRGGILDSIDSLLFAAPIFYLFVKYFIN